jgi:hypothetical protein
MWTRRGLRTLRLATPARSTAAVSTRPFPFPHDLLELSSSLTLTIRVWHRSPVQRPFCLTPGIYVFSADGLRHIRHPGLRGISSRGDPLVNITSALPGCSCTTMKSKQSRRSESNIVNRLNSVTTTRDLCSHVACMDSHHGGVRTSLIRGRTHNCERGSDSSRCSS